MRGAMLGSPVPQIAPGRTATVERPRCRCLQHELFCLDLAAVYASFATDRRDSLRSPRRLRVADPARSSSHVNEASTRRPDRPHQLRVPSKFARKTRAAGPSQAPWRQRETGLLAAGSLAQRREVAHITAHDLSAQT